MPGPLGEADACTVLDVLIWTAYKVSSSISDSVLKTKFGVDLLSFMLF